MSIDKLKSIAEKRGCEWYLNPVIGYKCEVNEDGIGLSGNEVHVVERAHTESLRQALNAAIKVIEVLSAANEFYLQMPVDNDQDYFHYPIPRGVAYLTAPSGKRARQAKREANEILKGVES